MLLDNYLWGIMDINMNIKSNSIGVRIALFRRALGLSQSALSIKAGMERTYIQKVETKGVKPNICATEKIAIALGLTIDELVGIRDVSPNIMCSKCNAFCEYLTVEDYLKPAKVKNVAEKCSHCDLIFCEDCMHGHREKITRGMRSFY